jgi:hypothetical protein
MATRDYIPVACDDWYQRRRKDAEGEFFRAVSEQGPRKGVGTGTRQGIYMLTADGKLLAFKNAGQAPDVMRDSLKQGLREWAKLPEGRRRPGAVRVPNAGRIDRDFVRTPPEGGLILKVFTRILDNKGGECVRGTCEAKWGDKAARDHMWLTAAEWKALIPVEPSKGKKADVEQKVVERILRFHMIDNTRGEPPFWTLKQIRKKAMTVTVESVTEGEVALRLDGEALLEDGEKRGFDARLLGKIRYDRRKKAITAFDVVAVGDHWGEGVFTRGARPGKTPLGISFELASGEDAGLVPPQGAKEVGLYMGRYR